MIIIKKFIWLIIFLLIVSFHNVHASSINYDLKIDENKHFHETITYTIEGPSDEHLNNILNNDVYFDLNRTQRYVKTVKSINDSKIVVLKHDYDYSAFNTSRIANSCFDEINYKADNQIVFSTFGDFKCNFADNISVSITSDIEVITNDADEVADDRYVWYVSDGFLYIGIRIGAENPNSGVLAPYEDTEATADDIGDTYTGIKKNNEWVIFGLIIGGSIGIITLVYIILNKKKKGKNIE